MVKKIFIFAYYSIKDPVFQSAVLPYFLNFPEKNKYQFYILTFEQKKLLPDKLERDQIFNDLKKDNIEWKFLKWHSGFLKSIKKFWDLIIGITLSLILIKRNKIEFIYSEGFPGSIISHYISKIAGIPHLVHTFEPHADYMLQSGIWKKKSWEYKILKSLEWKVGCRASYIFTATDLMLKKIRQKCSHTIAYRVPSCVDLELFKFSSENRSKIRKKYSLKEEDIVLCYLGKLGGMYWDEELFRFFRLCLNTNENFKFLIISKESTEKIESRLNQYNLRNNTIYINLNKNEVPGFLSAADFGITAIKQIPSRRYSSPIKNGEYWACGLPILIPKGISDDYLFAESKNIGIVLDDLSKENMFQIIKEIIDWNKSVNKIDIRNRCRQFVKEDRDVTKYQILYHSIFQNIN